MDRPKCLGMDARSPYPVLQRAHRRHPFVPAELSPVAQIIIHWPQCPIITGSGIAFRWSPLRAACSHVRARCSRSPRDNSHPSHAAIEHMEDHPSRRYPCDPRHDRNLTKTSRLSQYMRPSPLSPCPHYLPMERVVIPSGTNYDREGAKTCLTKGEITMWTTCQDRVRKLTSSPDCCEVMSKTVASANRTARGARSLAGLLGAMVLVASVSYGQAPRQDSGTPGARIFATQQANTTMRQAVFALIKNLHEPDATVRSAAAGALRYMGPEAKAAIPALADRLRDVDWSVRKAASDTLKRLGADVAVSVAQQIHDANPEVRETVVRTLQEIGPEAKAVIPTLVEALGDQSALVRSLAASTLRDLGPEAKIAIPALADRLRDADWSVSIAASHALERMGPEAVFSVVHQIRDADPRVRELAVRTLRGLGPDAKEAVPMLTESLWDADSSVRLFAISALRHVGPEAKTAIPALAERLRDGDANVRNAAVHLLERVGPEAIPSLTALLSDKEAYVRELAAKGLQQIGYEARQTASEEQR